VVSLDFGALIQVSRIIQSSGINRAWPIAIWTATKPRQCWVLCWWWELVTDRFAPAAFYSQSRLTLRHAKKSGT